MPLGASHIPIEWTCDVWSTDLAERRFSRHFFFYRTEMNWEMVVRKKLNYCWLILAVLIFWHASLDCALGQSQSFSRHELEYFLAETQLNRVGEKAESILDKELEVTQKLLAEIVHPPALAASLIRLQVVMESMNLIVEEKNKADEALEAMKGYLDDSVTKAHQERLGQTLVLPLSPSDRVYFVERAIQINEEARLIQEHMVNMLVYSGVALASIQGDPILTAEFVDDILFLGLEIGVAEVATQVTSGSTKDEVGTISAVGLVNLVASDGGRNDGPYQQYAGPPKGDYDTFDDPEIHVGFDQQDFKLNLDDTKRREGGGRVWRTYALGYEVPQGTVFTENVISRLGEVLVSVGLDGEAKIFASPGFDPHASRVTASPDKSVVNVNNIGLAMHIQMDGATGKIVAMGDPISAGEQSLNPTEEFEVTASPFNIGEKISTKYTVFVTGGNRYQSDGFFKFHFTIDAYREPPTDPRFVWDPVLGIYTDMHENGGPGGFGPG